MAERVTIQFVGEDRLSQPTQKASQALGGLQKAADGTHNALASMAKQAASVALGIGVFGIIQKATAGLGNAVIGLNARLEQSEMAFTTMLGSGEKAKKFLDELAVFAARTPFEFGELVDASKRLMAFGFQAKEVLPLMTSIGNAAAAMGGGAFMIQRITTALGQMSAKGKVAAQEMLQLTEAGIPAWDMLAKKLGVDVAGAMKKVEQRAVDAKTMIEAFQEGVTSRFGDMMAKQAKTFEGAMSTVRDSLQMAIATAVRPLFAEISAGTLAAADFLSGKQFQTFAASLATAIGSVVSLGTAIGGLTRAVTDHKEVQFVLVAALGMVGTAYTITAVKAGAYALGLGLVTVATRGMIIAQAALNAVLTANPIGLVVVALGGLAAGTIWAYESLDGFRKGVDLAWKALNDLAVSLGLVTAKTEALQVASQQGTVQTNYFGDSVTTLHGAFKKADDVLIPFNDNVQRMTVYMKPAEIAARNLASATHAVAETILRVNEIEGTPYIEQTIDDLRSEQQEMRGVATARSQAASMLETLAARTKSLSQANAIYGQGSRQSRDIIAQTAPLVNQLKGSYINLGASQKETVASAVSGFDSLVESLKRTDEQLVKTAEGAVKQGMAAAAKDLSDKIRLAKGDLSQLRDVTKLYGEDSEEARALTESLSSRLAELRGEYGSLDAVQRQQIDSLELEAQKLAQAASNWKEVGFAVEQVTQAIINQHPAVIATAAQVQVWQQRISGVNLALIANRDQMQAAQAELQGMQGHLTVLNQRLSDAKQRLTDLSAPKLTGQTEVENQIAAIQKQLERVSLAKLRGVSLDEIAAQFPILRQGMEQFVAGLPTDEGGLRKFLDILTKTKDLQFGEQLQMLGEAAKGAQTELTFDKALQGISQTKAEISSLTSEIANQEGAIRGQQSAINALQVASEGLNRVLADYQTKLRDAEEKQTLVNQALSVAYNYLLGGVRQRFIELGDEGVAQASVMDEETRKLLSSVLGAAQDTTDRSTIALKTMIKEYGDAMDKGIIAVQGSDGNSGLLGMNRILAGSIDDNTIKAAGLKQMLDSLQSKEITITTNYVSNYSSNGVPTHDYPGPAFAGQPYRIGVPEVFLPAGSVFTPPSNGYIAPTGQGGGNIIINNPTFWGMGEFEDMVLRAREKSQKRGRW